MIVRHYDDRNIFGVLATREDGRQEIEVLVFVWNVRGTLDYSMVEEPLSLEMHREAFDELKDEAGLENVSVYRGEEISVRLREWAKTKRRGA